MYRQHAHAQRVEQRVALVAGVEDQLAVVHRVANRIGISLLHADANRFAFRDGLRPRAPRITAPTLLIWGEDDLALGKELTYGMESLLVGELRIEYLANTSHWVMEERPAEVNRLLVDFLAR